MNYSRLALGVIAAMMLAACGSGGGVEPAAMRGPAATSAPTDTPMPTPTATPNPAAGYLVLPEGWAAEEEIGSLADMQGYGDLIPESGLQNAWQARLVPDIDDVEVWLTILIYEDEEAAEAAFGEADAAGRDQAGYVDLGQGTPFHKLSYYLNSEDPTERVTFDQWCRVVIYSHEAGSVDSLTTLDYVLALVNLSSDTRDAAAEAECD